MRIEDLDDDELSALYPRPGRPWLRVNFVSSVDGAASLDGLSTALSSPADKRVFRLLRMKCDALLVGAGTFRAEGYRPLTLDEQRRRWREEQGLSRYPVMVVFSASLDLDPGHAALTEAPQRPLILTTGDKHNAQLAKAAEIVRCDDVAHGLELLRQRGLGQVLCEGGPLLFGALSAADLVDELCLTLSPLLAGPGPGRIIDGKPHPPRRMALAHVLTADDGTVLLRHARQQAT